MMTMAMKEMLLSVRTVRFTVIVLVCCVLMPVSVGVLSSDYQVAREDYDSRVQLEARRASELDNDVRVFRPVPPLSAFYKGVQYTAIDGVIITEFVQNLTLASSVQSPMNALFPMIDLRFIIGIVLSALAILLSFDTINGEKQQGTLRHLLVAGVSRSSLYFGKWLGLSLAVLLPFALGMIINLVVYTMITGSMLPTQELTAYLFTILASSLYLMLFIALGMLASALTHSPAVSIIAGLGIWGVLTVLAPNALTALSDTVAPVPASNEIERNFRLLNNEALRTIRQSNMELAEELKQNPDLEAADVRAARRMNEWPLRRRYDKQFDDIETNYWQQVQHQESLGSAIALLSPLGGLSDTLTSLAATHTREQWRFLEESYRYGARFYDQVYGTPREPMSDEQMRALHNFTFETASLQMRLNDALVPLTSLLVYSALLLFVGAITFNRYDPR